MIGLDTNTLVRYLLRDDEKQARLLAARINEESESGHTFFINDVVLVELVWTLKVSYRFDKSGQATAIEQLLGSPHFEFENRDVILRAFALFTAGKTGFKDCLIGTKNMRLGCETTLTFDRDASKMETFDHV